MRTVPSCVNPTESYPYVRDFPVFSLAKEVGYTVRENTPEGSSVLVWAVQPQISFYALRKTPLRLPSITMPNVPFSHERVIAQDVAREKPDYIVVFDPLSVFDSREVATLLIHGYDKVSEIKGLREPGQGIYRRR